MTDNVLPKEPQIEVITPPTPEEWAQNAARVNGWSAMLGVTAAIGAYLTTGQLIPGIL